MKYLLILFMLFFSDAYAKDIKLVQRDGITYDFYANTPFSGTSLETYEPSGVPKEFTTYQDGLMHGRYETYYKNGQINAEATFLNGKPHGAFKKWFDDGDKEIETTYKDGELHGPYKKFRFNSKIAIDSNYLNGKLHGTYKEWFPNGDKGIEATYKNGELHGFYTKWWPSYGNKSTMYYAREQGNYVNGKPVGIHVERRENLYTEYWRDYDNEIYESYSRDDKKLHDYPEGNLIIE